MYREFTERALHIMRSIPEGRVITYGVVAILAGDPLGTRQVSRILHTLSEKHDLPWHRIINSQGRISLTDPQHYEECKNLLRSEGVEFSSDDEIDLDRYLWDIRSIEEIK